MAMSDARATLRRMMSVFVMRVMMIMMVMMLTLRPVDARCTKTKSGKGYSLTIGMLSAGENDFSAHRIVQKNLMMTGEVKDCFLPPHYLNLAVNETLQIPRKGWTKIQGGIEDALSTQGALDGEIPNLIIGPFYTNLAMMLQRMGIPYLVTDYKGFDWIDMSRVQDTVNWRTVVEIRPPAQAQNLAVVDLFLERKWSSAMMVMPESAADNQECQNLASQMLNHSLSLIPFTVEPRDPEVRTALSELLRNAKMFRQTQVLVCSPRDYRDQLIENILKEVSYIEGDWWRRCYFFVSWVLIGCL
ncbi:uncharacterized protein LOC101862347 [Aplysia californica]|uniref:Uncharacterized protein LOC101862347 n=1 Tax=Aplysia californica TaxID=6500 RepID=A0ABM1VSX0_APLCA|nr:uncharacterized protein LOC101862347 [Aplysia californica]XP_035825511.1 uncharacterized protein LOC101862347 [Aplysia californica]XP_035825512.1 uncharacterized protein LOC101862347 [Aplysia californica]